MIGAVAVGERARTRVWSGALIALTVLIGVALAIPAAAPAKSRADRDPAAGGRPNVIMIVTDDQPASTFTPRVMPQTFRTIADRGTSFEQAIVSTPLCCPARSVLTTGQYGHNNGVLHNNYAHLRDKRNVLPRWLQRAGYQTFHVGRFFNGYENRGRQFQVAPGWDGWRTALLPRRYYDYTLTTNKGTRRFGDSDRAHLTGNLSRIAKRIVRRRTPRAKPFYLQLDYFAPHIGQGSRDERCEVAAVPGPEEEDSFRGEDPPMPPSYDEADLSDKPAFMQSGVPSLSPFVEQRLKRFWGCALGSVRTVDNGIAEIMRTLRKVGGLDETVVVFTSDNGYLYGEHRLDLVKGYPYEEALRVPLVIRLPGRSPARPQRSDAPVSNVDIVPTLLELTGARPCVQQRCRVTDGRSLVPTLEGRSDIDPARAILIELDGIRPRDGLVCSYTGLRTATDVFVEHRRAKLSESGDCEPVLEYEHYRRATDPFQLDNLAGSQDPALTAAQDDLGARMRRLRVCAGIAGRDPQPESGFYCE